MYFRLALRNVKKSYRDFLVYFLTLSFSVCLFYTFNSFQEQEAVMQLNESVESVVQALIGIMAMLSVFVAAVLGFLMLYANNFLIKRRKKEFGIYMLLGMPRRKISRILIYETMIIGIISLLTGMFAGLFLSQILTAITANMFEVTLNYHFVFSWLGTFITLAAFLSIFAFLTILNSFILNRYQLIDLLNANKKNEKGKVRNLFFAVVLFILSVLCIGAAYFMALYDRYENFSLLNLIIPLGSIGTLLFFLSLSGFLLTIIKSSKHLYYKNLNCFVLRQLNNSINTSFISMSIICIMLLLSIGALATGLNLKETFNRTTRLSTPYDYSINAYYASEIRYGNEQSLDLRERVASLQLNPAYIDQIVYSTAYYVPTTFLDPATLPSLLQPYFGVTDGKADEFGMRIIPLSDFQQFLKDTGRSPLELADDEAYFFSDNELFRDEFKQMLSHHPMIELFDTSLTIKNTSYDTYYLSNVQNTTNGELQLVVPDHVIPENAVKDVMHCNISVSDDITPAAFSAYVVQQIKERYPNTENEAFALSYSEFDSESIRNFSIGNSVLFTYVGIYLGIVFLIASAVILALQQLSQADENKARYEILHKIGVEPRMRDRAILLQLGIYFMLPLGLAIIHSIVGVNMFNYLMLAYGKGDILWAASLTGGIFLLVYGGYFVLTYLSYKNILKT